MKAKEVFDMFDYISNLFSDVPHGFLLMFVGLVALSVIAYFIKKAIEILVSVAGFIIITALILGVVGTVLEKPVRAVKETVTPIVCEVQDFFENSE